MSKIVELISVTAGYEDEVALKDVNLTVNKHDFIGIIGPNGGGKTTLLKVILGIIKPISGEVVIGRELHNGNRIGYLSQINKIDNKFPISVREVVLSGLMSEKKFFGRYTRKDKITAENLLEQMGVLHVRNKDVGSLSGGELQRVYLCRAIISRPVMLAMDEPNTYVDSSFGREFYDILDELNKEMAIVIASHDVGTIFSHVKTIACVNRTLSYHDSNIISEEQLKAYGCPIDLVTHGDVPHRVLKKHN